MHARRAAPPGWASQSRCTCERNRQVCVLPPCDNCCCRLRSLHLRVTNVRRHECDLGPRHPHPLAQAALLLGDFSAEADALDARKQQPHLQAVLAVKRRRRDVFSTAAAANTARAGSSKARDAGCHVRQAGSAVRLFGSYGSKAPEWPQGGAFCVGHAPRLQCRHKLATGTSGTPASPWQVQ